GQSIFEKEQFCMQALQDLRIKLSDVSWCQLVSVPAIKTWTLVSFDADILVNIEVWRTLTAPYTLLSALPHSFSKAKGLEGGTARGTGGHTV
uniref:Uncharacterized protein n=1 Tax=Nothobranchius furzeri TaxID=105023 RepID=A0A8C6M456_NOTFU